MPKRSLETRGSYDNWINNLASIWGDTRSNVENVPYNYREYYVDNPKRAYAQLHKLRTNDPSAHFPDTYKLPTHPTFSNESKYSGRNGNVVGGTWVDNPNNLQRWTYQLSPSQVKNNWDVKRTLDYAEYAEDEGFKITDNKGRLPIVDGVLHGGILPNVTIKSKRYLRKGGR